MELLFTLITDFVYVNESASLTQSLQTPLVRPAISYKRKDVKVY
jgi:hypothetical protein